MTIIVGGYIVGFPLGGMTWHHLNYLLGLHEMGHEVWFLEDSGSWLVPYNPEKGWPESDSAYGRAYLEATLKRFGLPLRYCYYSEFENRYFGMTEDELTSLLKRADLLLCVSGVTPIRPSRPRAKRMAVIDTDPVFTQIRLPVDRVFREYYEQFDAVATFGKLIGQPGCAVPTGGFDWIPTNQPIALRHWPVVPSRSRAFSTVGKWEHATERHLEFEGKKYYSTKASEWMKVIDLPRRVPWEMRLGTQGMPEATRRDFERNGWKLIEAEPVTRSCDAFQDFIQQSAGEFTVVKEIYQGLPSGWFSDRSTAYLATGRPVVTQASGFDQWLPVGRGLFSFATADEAAAALNAIHADYPAHALAARKIAEEYFDARRVLKDLLDRVM